VGPDGSARVDPQRLIALGAFPGAIAKKTQLVKMSERREIARQMTIVGLERTNPPAMWILEIKAE
jgi:hypothetical protein